MSYPHKVKAHLLDDIVEMSKDPGPFVKRPGVDFSRRRKITFESLLRLLISMQSGSTAHELLKYFDHSLDTATVSAFYQQRQKLAAGALPYLLHRFDRHFPLLLHKGRYSLIACDGCEFNIARDPDDVGTFHGPSGKSTRGFNMLHTTSLYDILNRRYRDCVVMPGRKKNEYRAICDLVDRYSYADIPIIIADRGFCSYNLFAHAKEKGLLYLVRAKDINTLRILGTDTLPDHLDTYTEVVLSRSQSKRRRKHPELAKHYRYICPEVAFDFIRPGTDDEYRLTLRVVRFEVAAGVFENIVTNLPAEDFSAEEIMGLYCLRWGIETSFRDLKHTIGTTNFHSKQPEYIAQEIWARMILFNFCSIITAHVAVVRKDTRYVYQLNYAMATKIGHYFLRMSADRAPPDVEALIGSFTLPIRLERNYARQHRFQLPASFCYRPS